MEMDKSGLMNSLVCVEYPGVVQNVDKMIETLGGINEISKVCAQQNRRLELRFRPLDLYSKPACGDRVKTNTLLLKIKYLKKKGEAETAHKVKSCEVVGRVQTLFKFKSMCDFQFLPMAKSETGEMRSIYPDLLPLRVDGDNLKKWLDETAEYFLPPATFSRIDSQSSNTYMYRKDPKDAKDPNDDPLIGRTRKRRSGLAVFVSYDIPVVPSRPREKSIKFIERKFLKGQKMEQLRKCFEERPIWSKLALLCVTNFQNDHLKALLPAVAYYFVTGPFRVMWVRFGYDPRKDPEARIYQTLDYRIRAPAGLISHVKAKRSYSNNLLPSKSSHQGPKSVVITKKLCSLEDSVNNDCPLSKDSYIFMPTVIPPARQMFYQYCDIKAPEIEAMLSRLPKVGPNVTCDPKHGWLPPGFDVQCRDIINNYVMSLLQKESDSAETPKEEEYVDDSSDDEELPWEEEFEDEEIDDA